MVKPAIIRILPIIFEYLPFEKTGTDDSSTMNFELLRILHHDIINQPTNISAHCVSLYEHYGRFHLARFYFILIN